MPARKGSLIQLPISVLLTAALANTDRLFTTISKSKQRLSAKLAVHHAMSVQTTLTAHHVPRACTWNMLWLTEITLVMVPVKTSNQDHIQRQYTLQMLTMMRLHMNYLIRTCQMGPLLLQVSTNCKMPLSKRKNQEHLTLKLLLI